MKATITIYNPNKREGWTYYTYTSRDRFEEEYHPYVTEVNIEELGDRLYRMIDNGFGEDCVLSVEYNTSKSGLHPNTHKVVDEKVR